MRVKLILLFLILPYLSFCQSGWFSKNPLPQGNIYSIKFFNTNTGIGFSDNGVMLKTTNAGFSWQFIQTGTTKSLYSSFFIDNNTGYAVGDSGSVIKTTNSGNNWAILNSSVTNSLNDVFFINENTGYICGSLGIILRTTNGGVNWILSAITNKRLKTVFFTSTLTGYAGGDTSFVYKTTDGGLSWTSQLISPNYILDIYFIDATTGLIKTQFSLFRTSNGGNSWQLLNNNTGAINASIDFVNTTTGYLIVNNNQALKTTNAGLNWLGFGPQNIFFPFNLYSLDVLDTANIFISGDRGYIFKTNHSSIVWQHIGGNINNYTYFNFINVSTGYINSANFILATTNGGDKWIINSYGDNNWFEPTFAEYRKIVSRNNKMIRIYRSSGGGGPNFGEYVQYSTDGGATWPHIVGSNFVFALDAALADDYGVGLFNGAGTYSLRRINGGTILYSTSTQLFKTGFHNNNTGIIATQNSLLRTTNAGQNWDSQPLIVANIIGNIQLESSGTGIILCDKSIILRTTDFSSSWQVRYSGPVRFRQAIMLDDNNGFGISTTNKFANTTNGGLNWFLHETGATKRLNSVQFLNLNTGYIVGDSGTVLKTTDGGLTFINPIQGITPYIFSLSQNYPNPFNPTTNIKFDVPKTSFVKIIIYDALGGEIATPVNQQMQAGSYSVDWDASNYPSGVYFYKLVVNTPRPDKSGHPSQEGNYAETKKMVLIK